MIDDLHVSYARVSPEVAGQLPDLDRISFLVASPEDRRRLYGALRLRAEVGADGTITLTGVFDPAIRLLDVMKDGPADPSQPVPEARYWPNIVVASRNTTWRR